MSVTFGNIPVTADLLAACFGTAENAGIPVLPDYEGFHERAELLARTADELEAQDEEWGEQNHPLIVDPYSTHRADAAVLTHARYADLANQWKAANAARNRDGCLAWDGILLEEVFEALAEEDPAKAVTELIQAAAVAIQAAQTVERIGMYGAAA